MKDDFGDRMKDYENVTRHYLTKKIPVIMRLDGKAFHTLTRINFKEKPFDTTFVSYMDEVAKGLLSFVEGAKLAYVQSDEISLYISDLNDIKTNSWFNYNIQKMTSVAASYASSKFNSLFKNDKFLALFDARCYNIPKYEVPNYFIWRQMDCYRNAVNSIAQYHFSQKELNGKKLPEVKKMIQDKYEESVEKKFNHEFLWGRTFMRREDKPYVIVFKDEREMIQSL